LCVASLHTTLLVPRNEKIAIALYKSHFVR
jgi:hypothetical protein